MRWLIDGYNVIRREPDLRAEEGRSLEAGRRALIRLLSAALPRTADDFIVVFDGAPGSAASGPAGRIEIVFSRPPEKADDVLRRLATRWREGGVVVTSDRAVQDAARRLHSVVVGSEDFLAALAMESAAEDDGDDDDHHEAEPKRGNPRRRARDERAARRALRRLQGF